jgi:CubicO group peptidase (beta-lactamase class C family)
VSVTLNVAALGRLNSVGSFGWSGAATTTFSVDPEESLTYVIMAQLMPNDAALMQRVETLIYQAIVD